MAIKTLVKDTTVKPPVVNWKKVKYPCIGVADCGEAVLFSSFENGTVISRSNSPKNTNRLGEVSECWAMDFFTPAPSTKQFILSNV